MEKLQLSSMYGKFGDRYSNSERLRELIEPTGQNAHTPILISSEIPEDAMMERLMDGVKVIPVDQLIAARHSGKSRMSLKQIAEQVGISEDDILLASNSEGVYKRDDFDFNIMPEHFEGFKAGEVVIIDSMKSLDRKSGVDIDAMRRMAMELEAQEPVQLRLSRTEKRKQQRARASEERKLRKQLAKESKKTIHQTFEQTFLENKKLEDQIIHENNQRTIKEIDERIPELRGVGAGIYYDDTSFK